LIFKIGTKTKKEEGEEDGESEIEETRRKQFQEDD